MPYVTPTTTFVSPGVTGAAPVTGGKPSGMYTTGGGGGDGGGGRTTDINGMWVDAEGYAHGVDGRVSAGGSWVWQSGSKGIYSGCYSYGDWVPNPDAPIALCGKGPKPVPGISEEEVWRGVLESWLETHPMDLPARWLLGEAKVKPAWMGGIVAERGEPLRGEKIGEEPTGGVGWSGTPITKPVYEELPGMAETFRPMGGQLSLTSDEMEQLMYYYGYVKGGRPETAKGYLQEVAYRLPNWWQDYLALSESLMPKGRAPKARWQPAWQR